MSPPISSIYTSSKNSAFINKYKNDLLTVLEPTRKDILSTLRKCLRYLKDEHFAEKIVLQNFSALAIT